MFDPKTAYNNFYEEARFKLLWNMCIVFIVLILLVSISNLSTPNYSSIPNFIALIIACIALAVLAKTKKYEFVSKGLAIANCLIISLTFFIVKNVLHYTTPMWLIMNVLFTFFMLGTRWGIAIMFFHFSAFFTYIIFQHEHNIEAVNIFSGRDKANYIVEFILCGFGIAYIVYQFIATSKHAELKYRTANEILYERNEIITSQDNEKKIMLQEIHHRVKNNLQVVSSLLRLQSYELEGEKGRKEFFESIDRINAMALIHEKMYQTKEFTKMSIEGYLKDLFNDLAKNYKLTTLVNIEISSNLEQVTQTTLVPLALLFNELITNSIKHAFSQKKEGKITVEIEHKEENMFLLRYSDNGTWKEGAKKNSFGLDLIDSMVDQLDGSFNLNKKETGTEYSFILKNIIESSEELS